MTEAEIKLFVARTLGSGVIDMELTDLQLSDAVDAAKGWYAMLVGQMKSMVMTVSSAQTEYAVPDDCDFVVEVATNGNANASNWGWPLSTFNLNNMMPKYGRGSSFIADITQSLQYFELVQRTASCDLDWHYDEARRLLVLTPTNQVASQMRIWYMTNVVDVTKLKYYEASLVREYALAHAMETLGNIRTIYGEMPSAAGGFTMNGDLLNANALDRKRSLTEQLLALQPPALFITG